MKKKILLTLLAILFIAYISSYFMIRQNHRKVYAEREGCPMEGCVEIVFPANGFYHIYRPIIGLDTILTKSDFCNHGGECFYSR